MDCRKCSLAALLAIFVAASGCAAAVDLTKTLRLDDVSTGWVSVGVVNGQNKVVPAVTLKLTNQSDQTLSTLQLNAVFRRIDQEREWGTGFMTAAGSGGLAPAASTAVLLLKSERGYTGADPAPALLGNSAFVDARVDVFAKYGATGWARVGAFPIRRVLIAR